MRLASKLKKLRALPAADRRWLLQAALTLPVVVVGLRLIGFRRLALALGKGRPGGLVASSSAGAANEPAPVAAPGQLASPGDLTDEIERAGRLRRAVDAAARIGPLHGNCLSQSLTLWLMLRRQGIDSELRIGVRKEAGQLLAHAWVEHQGQALNDSPLVYQRFATFERPVLPEAVRWR